MKNLIISSLIYLLITGCAKPSPIEPITLNKAHQKLIDICKKDFDLTVKLFPFENTLWVYIPMEESFLDIKSTDEGPRIVDQFKETRTINYLDGWYADSSFHLKYDITLSKAYGKEYGFTSAFTDKYRKEQQYILLSITKAYENVEEEIPDFFVIVAADIVKGIETQMILNFSDLKRVMTDQFFHEEYTRRNIMDYPTGHTKIIDDKEGKHLELYDLTWPDFLAKQMVHRIKNKYQRSAFPPSEDTQQEILTIVSETVHAYEFTGFETVQLQDLHNETTYTTNKSDLKKPEEKEDSKSRLINIKFL